MQSCILTLPFLVELLFALLKATVCLWSRVPRWRLSPILHSALHKVRSPQNFDSMEVPLRFSYETIEVILRILNGRLLYSIYRALPALKVLLAWLDLLLLMSSLFLIAHRH